MFVDCTTTALRGERGELRGFLKIGQDVIERRRTEEVAHVEQDMPGALLGLTMREAVRRALPQAEREHEAWRVGVVLDEFETPDDICKRPVAALSGGWQRLVLLVRAWVT